MENIDFSNEEEKHKELFKEILEEMMCKRYYKVLSSLFDNVGKTLSILEKWYWRKKYSEVMTDYKTRCNYFFERASSALDVFGKKSASDHVNEYVARIALLHNTNVTDYVDEYLALNAFCSLPVKRLTDERYKKKDYIKVFIGYFIYVAKFL